MTQPPGQQAPSEATPTSGTASQVRGETTDSFSRRWAKARETKPSYLTTELWLTIAGVVALIITYNVRDDTSLDLWRTCLLATILGAAYVVSRGLAKAASDDEQHIPQHLREDAGDRWTRT